MFEKWHWPADQYHTCSEYGRLIQIETTLSRLLAMPEDRTPPIIIMEERHNVIRLEEWVRKNPRGTSQRNAYYIRTWMDNPRPIIPRVPYYKSTWEALVKKLDSVGVKKILMGGMQFEVSLSKTDWTRKPPWVSYCVGIALSHLSKDKAGKFEVDVSALVDCPYSRGIYMQCVNETRLKNSTQLAACT
jgi:hypothetical protein